MPDYPYPDCPTCSAPMRLRNGQFGLFYGCSTYPLCETTMQATADGCPILTRFTDGELKVLRRCIQDDVYQAATHLRSTVAWVEGALSRELLGGRAFRLHSLTKEECGRILLTLKATLEAPPPAAPTPPPAQDRQELVSRENANAYRQRQEEQARQAQERVNQRRTQARPETPRARVPRRARVEDIEETVSTAGPASVYERKLDL